MPPKSVVKRKIAIKMEENLRKVIKPAF
jgi:hypothetical protein